MKAYELISELNRISVVNGKTVDTVKYGSDEREVKKLAVAMHGTVNVIKEASKWGADLLIVHEPIYYNHDDNFIETPVTVAKKELLSKSGLTVFRYHDHMHSHFPDLITQGEMNALGLKGKVIKTDYYASYLFIPDQNKTASELAEIIKQNLSVKHLRVCGEMNKPIKKMALCFGTPAGVFDLLSDETVDAVLTGEACEWQLAEYARDAAQLGINKSLFIIGHCGSERDGMKLLAQNIERNHSDISVKYFECEEVYNTL